MQKTTFGFKAPVKEGGFLDKVGNFFGDVGSLVSNAWNDITSKGLSGIWNDYSGITANQQNLDYQKEYNEEVFKRADTQFQRTVADLRAAGLSSQLAAGAPSTVAGSSQAPQRTVGNESAAIEKLIGMVNSIKQTGASANLANAQADKAKAEADYINTQNGMYGEKTASEIARNNAEARRNTALAVISEKEGETFARKFEAVVNNILQDTENKKAAKSLAEKQLEYYDAYTGNLKKTGEKIDQEINNLKQEYNVLLEKVRQEVYKTLSAGYQSDIDYERYVQEALNSVILQYNYDLSVEMGLRTTDAQSKVNIFGLSTSNLEALLKIPDGYSAVSDPTRPYGL